MQVWSSRLAITTRAARWRTNLAPQRWPGTSKRTARPPITPCEAAINGTMFTPFVGVPMQTALDLCIVWSLYGLYMCKNYWPCPTANPAGHEEGGTLQMRTPWLTSWARATFEQGVLSVLPMLEGPCTAASLPGERLFQASALPRNRMRPAIFHAFGKAKVGAQIALRDLEKQGWETCQWPF